MHKTVDWHGVKQYKSIIVNKYPDDPKLAKELICKCKPITSQRQTDQKQQVTS